MQLIDRKKSDSQLTPSNNILVISSRSRQVRRCRFSIHGIRLNLPQHVGKRRIWLSSILLALVVALTDADNGNDSHVWLSEIQKRASCTKRHPSTKHLVQLFSVYDNLFVHVPQPIWATIRTPDPDKFSSFSWPLLMNSLEKSLCQLGQPITPNTISPSTTRAKPTWNFRSSLSQNQDIKSNTINRYNFRILRNYIWRTYFGCTEEKKNVTIIKMGQMYHLFMLSSRGKWSSNAAKTNLIKQIFHKL